MLPKFHLVRIALASCCLSLAATAPQADAALKKYRLAQTNIASVPEVSPNPNLTPPDFGTEGPVALIDDSGASPVLRKLLYATDLTNTAFLPGLLVGIFTSTNWREGPGAAAIGRGEPAPSFTGTGSTAAGSAIAWGIVTGWTVTGSFWCNSNPGVICSLLGSTDEVTTEPLYPSEFYDLGTWTFHGTGFTATPYFTTYATSSFGNLQNRFRGPRVADSTVPAAPLLGVLLLGGSLIAGGVAAVRRGGPPQ